eukprot:9488250-Pyramimonas_sp.AAC.1
MQAPDSEWAGVEEMGVTGWERIIVRREGVGEGWMGGETLGGVSAHLTCSSAEGALVPSTGSSPYVCSSSVPSSFYLCTSSSHCYPHPMPLTPFRSSSASLSHGPQGAESSIHALRRLPNLPTQSYPHLPGFTRSLPEVYPLRVVGTYRAGAQFTRIYPGLPEVYPKFTRILLGQIDRLKTQCREVPTARISDIGGISTAFGTP